MFPRFTDPPVFGVNHQNIDLIERAFAAVRPTSVECDRMSIVGHNIPELGGEGFRADLADLSVLRIVRGTDNLNQPVDIAGAVVLGEKGQPPVQPNQLGVQAVALV